MSRWLTVIAISGVLLLVGVLVGVPRAQVRTIVTPEALPTTASAVVVEADATLVHTGLILPLNHKGELAGRGRADVQAIALFDRLEDSLRRVGSGLDQVVKLNLQAASQPDLWQLNVAMAKRMAPAKRRPAIASVVGTLPDPDARVALDAVAVASPSPPGSKVRRLPSDASQGAPTALAVLPPGGRVYVSGQAEPGTDFPSAVRKTLAGLSATLDHLELNRDDVVQLKAFLQPMTSAETVRKEVETFFAPTLAPPLVLVEWKSSASLPIEIELIAGAPERPGGPVEYITPPALKPSPVFSRVARVGKRELIYVSEIFGPKGGDGKTQVEAIFRKLEGVLQQAGSDLRHLVKATYYVTDDEAGKALNDLRPKYYDPARPPTASKALVAAIGNERCSVTFDMIAVSTRPTSAPAK